MASPKNFNFPFFSPPPPQPPNHPASPPPPSPPYHPITPPSPHVHPPPPTPIPPPPSPNNHHTVIIIVFVSCGGLFLLTFLAVALFCFLKKNKKKTIKEAEIVHVDEHLKMKEAIVSGPHGPHAVVLEIEDDIHIDKKIAETEEISQCSNVRSAEGNPKTSSLDHHHWLEHKA